MKKYSVYIILSGIILVLVAALVGVLIYLKNQPPQRRGIQPIVEIAKAEPESALWGRNFPNEYSTYQETLTNNTRTKYGGSEKFSKLAEDPRLVILFKGYTFEKEYNEDRGHLNSLTDVRATKRLNEKTAGTCYSCKSSDNPRLWAEIGMAEFDKTPFSVLGERIKNPIGCANCHEAGTMRLIVTNPALEEALIAQGKDWQTFSRQEMRTIVCANCHVEYYFAGEGKYLTFPWKNGTRIENIAQYYIDINFIDWTHPDSNAAMIKMQHPDYELFSADSTHYLAGVSCADCHMPYLREGAVKFSSHDVESPLVEGAKACSACHTDVEYVKQRVGEIQDQVNTTLLSTEDALVEAIRAIQAAAGLPNVNTQLLDEARKLHREAQLRWDFIAAENSMGFHNPEEALRILAVATNLARQAQIKAFQASGSSAALQTGGN